MDKRKTYKICSQILGCILGFCLVACCFVYGKKEYGNQLFYTFLIIGLLALIFLIIFVCLQLFSDRNFKEENAKNLQLAQSTFEAFQDLDKESALEILQNTNFENELELIRCNYNNDKNPQKNKITNSNIIGTKPLRDFSVLKNGQIYYACLVEANSKIFEPSKFVHQIYPAVVIYSTNKHYEKYPQELVKFAECLYNNKHQNILKNETNYFYNIKLDESMVDINISENCEIYITTILLYRYHLPMGRLIVGGHMILPIIANPKTSTSTFVVDSKYWTNKILINNMVSSRNIEKVFQIKNELDK